VESSTGNEFCILAEKQPIQELPYFFVVCGTEDELIEPTRQLVALLQRRKIAHNYMGSPGGHIWDTSDHQLPMMFGELARHVELPRSPLFWGLA
jgi:S-formylglutathione hydrolase FrmB